MCSVCVLPVFACVCLCFLSVKKPSNNKRGSSIEAPGSSSVAWVAKGNKIIFDFVYLCPSAVPCGREWLVRPTTRQFQKLHVVPDIPHDLEHVVMPDLTVHLLLDPREGHLRLGSKEGAVLVSAFPFFVKSPQRKCFGRWASV